MLVTGANGAGKTNLLESLHVGTQGFSPRTRADAQLVRLGAGGARIALGGERSGRPLQLELTIQPHQGKRAKLNGAPLRSTEQLRSEVSTLVFTPDRLAVVKGAPAVRRAYFDRSLSRLLPGRASSADRLRRRRRPTKRCASPGRRRSRRDGCDRAVDAAGRESRHAARRREARGARAAVGPVSRAGGRARPPRCDARLRRRAAYCGRARGEARQGCRARRDRARASPGRDCDPLRLTRAPELRLSGRAAAGRSLAAARGGRGAGRVAGRAAARPAGRRPLRARWLPVEGRWRSESVSSGRRS